MALMARGHADSLAVLDLVHTLRCLALLMRAWRDWLAVALRRDARQPFFSVWPVRTLRSDVEPTNFVAQLGFYAMDKCTPLMAGSWNAVKAGADAPPERRRLAGAGRGQRACSVAAARPVTTPMLLSWAANVS